jgi:3-methyladenine DNA glycosylase Mpg
MSNLINILKRPENLREEDFEIWFSKIAQELLNKYYLVASGKTYRLLEIEFYCCTDKHPDYFTHRDKLQTECGRWYFHRLGTEYKSGSFKGLDLTFGDESMYGGILIRSIESSDGTLICGPSLCVDNILQKTNSTDIKQLDEAIADRFIWDADNPLKLELAAKTRLNKIYSSARIGLTLKKNKSLQLCSYIVRPYRYLSEPRTVTKGKIYLALALHIQGISIEEIHQITGSPNHTIRKYIDDFNIGRQLEDFSSFFGIDLNTSELCQLHGTFYSK